MSQYDPAAQPGADIPPEPQVLAGEMLRGAREAAGLSIDDVAQQLKLAPRQVVALEENDFTHLPGRTFVRGFARNYARLLQLDPQAVIDALPGASGTGGLESPALHATTVSIGELPSEARARAAWLGWLLLVVVIAGAAYMGWQYLQGPTPRNGVTPPASGAASAPGASASAVAPSTPTSDAAGAGAGGLALPNPTLSVDPVLGSAAAPDQNTPPGPADGAAPRPFSANAPLTVAVRNSSWVEIKDASGKAVLAETLGAGQSQAVGGTPPFDIVIGNAPGVTLAYRGQAIDLAPYTRSNVARFKLQ